MPVDEKFLERVRKLINRANPKWNSNEHERESAALEAVRLIIEHDLTIGQPAPPPPVPQRRRPSSQRTGSRPPTPWSVPPPSSSWGGVIETFAVVSGSCIVCGKAISRGEKVYATSRGMIHHEMFEPTCSGY